MFTGLIEAVCTVRSAGKSGDSMRLSVDLGDISAECEPGDSIAVSGTCLTVTAINGTTADFDISGETFAKSTAGNLRAGDSVNIERAMRADGRFGGHFVQGHVDGTAVLEKSEQKGQFRDMRFKADAGLLGLMVLKGSVAVNGISLTISQLDDRGFSIAVIPETFSRTTLGKSKVGDEVNIEIDLIVKTIRKQLDNMLGSQGNLTVDKLREMGF